MSFLCLALLFLGGEYLKPAAEQIHLSAGADASQMLVTWVTQHKPTGESSVEYHEAGSDVKLEAFGEWQKFKAGKKHKIYVHRVLLDNLKPGSTYHYKVSTDGEICRQKYSFRTLSNDMSPKLLIFGDLGTDDAISLPNLIGEVENQNADVVFHVGDLAYNLNDKHGRNGDKFMNMIEPIAANVAYQVLPGNHEKADNFSHYDNLFSMTDSRSGLRNNFYYSTNIGPLHVITITTEFYFYPQFGTDQIQSQYNWLVSDLKEATKAGNRKLRPWIIVMTHRPMYCSADRDHHCTEETKVVRDGYEGKFGLEDLLHEHRVDLYVAGHAHIYERSFPVYRGKVSSNSSHPYHNAKSMVHVVTGSAGNDEGLYEFFADQPVWSAKRLADYGYTRLFADRQTLRLQQITDQDGRVIDEFKISKDPL